MKYLILTALLITPVAKAQNLGEFFKFVSPGAKVNAPVNNQKPSKYSFITPPKDKKLGNYRVTCYLDSGMAIPELTNLQVKEIESNFTHYNYVTMDNKIIQAPVEKCVNIQN